MTSQPPASKPSHTLKRKASSDMPADSVRTIDTEDPVFQHLTHDASRYRDTYTETVMAIRELLASIRPPAAVTTTTAAAAAAAAADEQGAMAILNDLKMRPELAKMEDAREILAQCGIEMKVVVKEGKEEVTLKFNGREV